MEEQDDKAMVIIYSASNIHHYGCRWRYAFGQPCLNFGYSGDRIEQLRYRVVYGCIPKNIKVTIIHIPVLINFVFLLYICVNLSFYN